ncbi:hypothetical protein F4808DRAFT_117401 [Astrocystis sublimbata]|nr:hypothetical protein F4808DRAFT_117401 [Astrocystis sublimbata]
MPPRTRKKGPEPNPDLPGLFPTHDGSYGINTLISIEPESRKGHKSNKGDDVDQTDDQKWATALRGKLGKKYGMNSNLKKAIDESHKEVQEEEHLGKNSGSHHSSQGQSGQQSQSGNQPPGSSGSNIQAAPSPPASHESYIGIPYDIDDITAGVKPSSDANTAASFRASTHPPNPSAVSHMARVPGASGPSGPSSSRPGPRRAGSGPGPSEPPDDSGSIPVLAPHVPDYNPKNPPFREEYADKPRPPYTRSSLPSEDSYSHSSVSQRSSRSSRSSLSAEYIPFYGMPKRAGGNEPISTKPPDTSRSYKVENGLFANAMLQTPSRYTAAPRPPATTTSRPPQPAPNTQPNLQSQHRPGGRTRTGYISPSADESDPVSQLDLLNKFAPVQPTSGSQPPTRNQPATNIPFNLTPPDSNENRPPSGQNKAPGLGTTRAPPNRRGTSNSDPPQTGKTITNQRKSPNTRRGPTRSWTWVSLDNLKTFILSVIFFMAVLAALLFLLPIPSDDILDSDNGNGLALNLPNMDVRKMWDSFLSKITPDFPDIHPMPSRGTHSHATQHRGTRKGPSGSRISDSRVVGSDELQEDLKDLLPEKIWVQGQKDGKLKPQEDFYHALNDHYKRMIKDSNILSLKNGDLSEDHWHAIESRILHAGLGGNATTKDVEALVKQEVSRSWDNWLRLNDKTLKTAKTGTTLTKDEFMDLIQEEVSTYKDEIGQEIPKLQQQIKAISKKMSQFRDEVGSFSGKSQAEITRKTKSLLSEAVDKMKIEALSRGVIKGHATDVVANQVNFFTRGSGAAIDAKLTSTAWKPAKDAFKSNKWLDKDGYKAQPPFAALSAWNEEGECFCAGPDLKGHGVGTNNISVVVGRNIIPTHLVVEHILPGATLDPGAMPKEIEVWAYIEQVDLRNELQALSEVQFPNTPKEEVLNEGYVKMGHFTYEKLETGDGVQVFKISDELVRMHAWTNSLVVRAINNYGADHTCFYRLHIYGQIIERPDGTPTHNNTAKRTWFW